MNGTKIASKAKARLANFMGKVFGKLQYPKGQSILSKAQFHIKLGGAASPLPAKPAFPNPTPKPYKRQNQSIRKNSTIPQSDYCSQGVPTKFLVVAFPPVAVTAEHMKVFGRRLAALRPRNDVIALHFLDGKMFPAFWALPFLTFV